MSNLPKIKVDPIEGVIAEDWERAIDRSKPEISPHAINCRCTIPSMISTDNKVIEHEPVVIGVVVESLEACEIKNDNGEVIGLSQGYMVKM